MRHFPRLATTLPATTLAISLLSGGVPGGGPASAAALTVSRQAQVGKDLRRLEVSFKGRIGAYAIDTATGTSVMYRAGERFR